MAVQVHFGCPGQHILARSAVLTRSTLLTRSTFGPVQVHFGWPGQHLLARSAYTGQVSSTDQVHFGWPGQHILSRSAYTGQVSKTDQVHLLTRSTLAGQDSIYWPDQHILARIAVVNRSTLLTRSTFGPVQAHFCWPGQHLLARSAYTCLVSSTDQVHIGQVSIYWPDQHILARSAYTDQISILTKHTDQIHFTVLTHFTMVLGRRRTRGQEDLIPCSVS